MEINIISHSARPVTALLMKNYIKKYRELKGIFKANKIFLNNYQMFTEGIVTDIKAKQLND